MVAYLRERDRYIYIYRERERECVREKNLLEKGILHYLICLLWEKDNTLNLLERESVCKKKIGGLK